MVASVGAAQNGNCQSVRTGRELTGLTLAPTVRVGVLVGGRQGARRHEGGELQSQIANVAATLTDRSRAGRTVVTACGGQR